MKKIFSKSISGLDGLAELASDINKMTETKSIILLTGDLGAGKTAFVSAFCKIHNISQVSSPTYAIHNRYDSGQISIDHLDLYRLEDRDKLESAGVFDIFQQLADYKFIEWPERVNGIETYFTNPTYKLILTKTGETGRQADFFKIS